MNLFQLGAEVWCIRQTGIGVLYQQWTPFAARLLADSYDISAVVTVNGTVKFVSSNDVFDTSELASAEAERRNCKPKPTGN